MAFCCRSQGSCEDVGGSNTQAECERFGGKWSDFGDCSLVECSEFGGDFIPLGACCDDNTKTCKPATTFDSVFSTRGSCAGDAQRWLQYQHCFDDDGVSLCFDEPPPPPPPSEGCVQPGNDRWTEGDKGWHRDLCQTALLRPNIDATGRAYPVTVGEIRALPDNDKPCALHRGHVALLPGGRAAAVFCTMPNRAKIMRENRHTTIAHVYVDDAGKTGFVGSYKTPWIAEVRYHSHKMPCLGIIR